MRVELKPGAMRWVRYMPETVKALEGHGLRIKARANSTLQGDDDGVEGYRMSSQRGDRRPWGRHRVTVITYSTYAQRSDRKHNTLVKLLGQQ